MFIPARMFARTEAKAYTRAQWHMEYSSAVLADLCVYLLGSDIATTISCCILVEVPFIGLSIQNGQFQDHDHVYKSFLAVLKMRRDRKKTITIAYKELYCLLLCYPNIIWKL